MSSDAHTIRICLFCGGRGSATLIRELLHRPEIELSLLVNAFDDGLSTGALRNFIPGMLGPSDFRKNLSYLLDLYSTQQYALQQLFEHRLPLDFSSDDLAGLRRFVASDLSADLSPALARLLDSLAPATRQRVRALLLQFFEFHDARAQEQPFDFADCSFGNLIFAGAYLEQQRDFNAAARVLAEMANSRARLINVSEGENRILLGLKADGELLASEAMIVGKQSTVAISEIFFLRRPLDLSEWALIADRPLIEKLDWLRKREEQDVPSAAAIEALKCADIIIFGPGTQHSSLLPSYRIVGESILASPALVKILVTNLREDHDIQSLDMTMLVDRALHYLDDPWNDRRGITHVLYNAASADWVDGIKPGTEARDSQGGYKGAAVIEGDFVNPCMPNLHSGFAAIDRILELYEQAEAGPGWGRMDIYVDLVGRLHATQGLIQELLEIHWNDRFRSVALHLDTSAIKNPPTLPPYMTIRDIGDGVSLSEFSLLHTWLLEGNSEYLVTITGDGEYRLHDILRGVDVLDNSHFGALFGSRTQSRRQFRGSLRAAYGESGIMFRISLLGAFIVTTLMSFRFGLIFSDPLTGFRIYRRSRLGRGFEDAVRGRSDGTAIQVTKLLIDSHVEIAEIPVPYRTFAGFTQPKWRFRRGLKNLRDSLT
jgi:2-phospho-L-lactate transferase/gluconeogenesis factor (CofD/UPF0052 family)